MCCVHNHDNHTSGVKVTFMSFKEFLLQACTRGEREAKAYDGSRMESTILRADRSLTPAGYRVLRKLTWPSRGVVNVQIVDMF